MCSRYLIAFINCLVISNGLAEASPLQLTPRIFGDEDASADRFPYTVSLRDSQSHKHFCGGALISTKHVLSAGHCVNKRKWMPYRVYAMLGIASRSDHGTRKNVKKIVLHPEFNERTGQNDIAILTFYTDVSFTEQIQPIALPQSNVPEDNIRDGIFKAIISGWGRIKETYLDDSMNLVEKLHFQTTIIINRLECIKLVPILCGKGSVLNRIRQLIHNNVICAKNDPPARNGDSGTPLVTTINGIYEIIGILSWSIDSAQDFPDIYSNVYSHSDWIQGIIQF